MESIKRKAMVGARFLSFLLNGEEYCIEILRIKEIIAMTPLAVIPQTPLFIKGVLNLRGQIIPVIDLRLKFQMSEREYTDRTGIIIVELIIENDKTFMGIVVDTIREVVSIPAEKINKTPYINARVKSEFIQGMAELGDGIKIILDINKVLTEEEFVAIKGENK